MSPQVFSIMSALIEEKSGLHYALADIDNLTDKVSACAVASGFDSLLDYYYFLRYETAGQQALDSLIERLVVQESYFFRELDQLEVLVSHFLMPMIEAGGRPRVWSAACAHGEEPLSIAMLLAERNALDQVDLVASDISARAVSRAREGKFSRRAVRSELKVKGHSRWLDVQDECVNVPPELVGAVAWHQINLLDAAAVAALGVFDVILCRNVLIYFRDSTVPIVLDQFARALPLDGTLLVGVSESLLRFGSVFQCEEHGGVFVYRKAVQ